MNEIKFKQNFTLFENIFSNISFPTITKFNRSKDLDILDSNHENKVQSFVNLENVLILIISIVISSILTLTVLAILWKIKKCLSLRKKCNKNFKIDKVPITIEMDHNLRKLPTNLENKIISDINKFENRKKHVVSNDIADINKCENKKKHVVYNEIEVIDYWLPDDNY